MNKKIQLKTTHPMAQRALKTVVFYRQRCLMFAILIYRST